MVSAVVKVSGAKELEVWGETERQQAAGFLYGSVGGRTMRERVSEMYANARSGARSTHLPTDLPAAMVRHLEVEAAFLRLAMKGAMEYLGYDSLRFDFDALPDGEKGVYLAMVRKGAMEIRSICRHVYVHRRPVGQYRRDRVYVHLAQLGVTRAGFTKLLNRRIEAVKAEIELRTFEE